MDGDGQISHNPADTLTVDTCEYINNAIGESEKRFVLKFEALQNEFSKAETTLNIRLESMNEFRQQLKDQMAEFARRDEINFQFRALWVILVSMILLFIAEYIRRG